MGRGAGKANGWVCTGRPSRRHSGSIGGAGGLRQQVPATSLPWQRCGQGAGEWARCRGAQGHAGLCRGDAMSVSGQRRRRACGAPALRTGSAAAAAAIGHGGTDRHAGSQCWKAYPAGPTARLTLACAQFVMSASDEGLRAGAAVSGSCALLVLLSSPGCALSTDCRRI